MTNQEITELLQAWERGEQADLEKLIPLVMGELRSLAKSYLRRERSGHTLQTTALVNEAYLKLAGQNRVHWQNRDHFFAIAAQCMRRILTDYAKAHRREKRGGGGAASYAFRRSSNVDGSIRGIGKARCGTGEIGRQGRTQKPGG